MITKYMTEDHRKCDENFGEIEILVEKNQFDQAKKEFIDWKSGMEAHLNKEEQFLFPEAEMKLGGQIGPIMVMKMEHAQMRDVFSNMEKAIDQKNANAFLGLAESCMILIQQHNMKEEQILYPLLDRALADHVNEIVEKLQDGKFS